MIFDYWHRGDESLASPEIDELLKTGLEIGAYIENIGWSHPGLVEMARQYGYEGYNKDLAHIPPQEAWEELIEDLKKYPIMASVYKGLNPEIKSGHVVVVSGLDGPNIYINDPLEGSEERGKQIIPVEKFLAGWKQRYIAVRPLRKSPVQGEEEKIRE